VGFIHDTHFCHNLSQFSEVIINNIHIKFDCSSRVNILRLSTSNFWMAYQESLRHFLRAKPAFLLKRTLILLLEQKVHTLFLNNFPVNGFPT
jgi:hypothetical protein